MIGNAFFLSLREIRNNLLRAGLTTLGAMAWFVVRGLRNPNRA